MHYRENIVVLDSNIILNDPRDILNQKDCTVIIPEIAIYEVNAKLNAPNEVGHSAREFSKLLQRADLIETRDLSDPNVKELLLDLDGVDLRILRLTNYCSSTNSAKLFESLAYLPERAEFLSNDVVRRYEAIINNISLKELKPKKTPQIQKTIEVDYSVFANMPKSAIELDPEYTPDVFCYIVKSGDSSLLTYVVNGYLKIIDDDLFNHMPVRPMNSGQRFALASMLDTDVDISVVAALAGSGKTLMAVSAGIKHMRTGNYDKITYIRNSVESTDKAEGIGFLPGLEEKFKIYNYPLFDTLEYIANKTNMKGTAKKEGSDVDERVYKLMEKHKIETLWNGAARGRTISNSYVIIDEVQNFSKSSLQTILSRIDKDCKVIMIGSNNQIDHPYINKHNNGLSVILESLFNDNPELNIHASKMDKVLRGNITEFAERVFSTN